MIISRPENSTPLSWRKTKKKQKNKNHLLPPPQPLSILFPRIPIQIQSFPFSPHLNFRNSSSQIRTHGLGPTPHDFNSSTAFFCALGEIEDEIGDGGVVVLEPVDLEAGVVVVVVFGVFAAAAACGSEEVF